MSNNMVSRRHFMKMTAFASGALALAACAPAAAPGAAPAAGDAAAPAGDAAAPAAEVQKIVYWHGWGNLDPALEKIVVTDEFKQHVNTIPSPL